MESHAKKIAIISGASSGLGEVFVLEIDKKKEVDEIWLIARREDRLHKLSKKLTHSKGLIFPLDLTNPTHIKNLKQSLEAEKPQICYLINNAGFGLIGEFQKLNLDRQLNMIDLNVRALTELTHLSLSYCSRGSQIIQIASSAGFFPLPGFATYAATKAYVVHFANALASELKEHGIHVMAVCPGPVDTEFFDVAHPSGKKIFKLPHAKPLDVVSRALRDSSKKKLNSIHGLVVTFFVKISGIIPRCLLLTKASSLIKKSW